MSNFDIKLISLVKKFPHLYDKTSSEFKNRMCHETSWQYIADELKLQVADCTSRWQALRNRYSKERAKVGNHKEWVLLKHLDFLNTVVKKRKTFGLTGNRNMNEIVEDTKQEEVSPVFSFLEIVDVQSIVNNEDRTRSPMAYTSASTSPAPIQNNKRKRDEDEPEDKANCRTISGTSIDSETFESKCSACSDESTSIKSFCLSLVDDMFRMKPSDLRRCKIEMLQVICKYSND